MGRIDFETETLIPVTGGFFSDVAHPLKAGGHDGSEDGTGRGVPLVPLVPLVLDWYASESRSMPVSAEAPPLKTTMQPAVAYQCHGTNVGPMGTLRKGNGNETSVIPFVVIPFDITQITSAENFSAPKAGDQCHPLARGAHAPAIAIQERAVSENVDAGPQGKGWQEDIAYTLESRNKVQAVADGWAVRRLTPIECARLMGFPDDHCFIPVRKVKSKRVEKTADKYAFCLIDGEWWEMASDGPQYKAYGNSIVTKVLTWLGSRIDAAEASLHTGLAVPA